MKIIINLMPLNYEGCDLDACKDSILQYIEGALTSHLKDHVHSIEVLGD